MRHKSALIAGKLISLFSKKLKLGGGSAAPGLYALKIDPNLVQKLTAKIPLNVVITGTNGKTTTARLLAHFAEANGLRVIRNSTGSNLERGVASTLITHPNLGSYDLGIWELDEAAFNSVAPKINPQLVVFLNVFRDQLDRYGEVDNVVTRWCDTLQSLSSATSVIVNGDDLNTRSLASCFKGKVEMFSVHGHKIQGERAQTNKFTPQTDFRASDVKFLGLTGSSFKVTSAKETLRVNLPLPGLYHIYDFLAAFSLGLKLRLDPQKMSTSLSNFSPAFGRVEKIDLDKDKTGYILLIKNPTGASQVFQTIAPELKVDDCLLFALNDNLADGTDVSWIWDSNFEILANIKLTNKIVVSGTRAEDLALRLKYAGVANTKITVEKDLFKALQVAKQAIKGRVFILPTYTALLQLQTILAKMRVKTDYWRET